jgi:hypothetical protein
VALVYTIDNSRSRKGDGQVFVTIQLDGSYAAGGYALSNSSMGMLDTPHMITMQYVHATATNDFQPVWDRANNKLKVFKTGSSGSTLAECTSGDITSSHSVQCVVSGRPIL